MTSCANCSKCISDEVVKFRGTQRLKLANSFCDFKCLQEFRRKKLDLLSCWLCGIARKDIKAKRKLCKGLCPKCYESNRSLICNDKTWIEINHLTKVLKKAIKENKNEQRQL